MLIVLKMTMTLKTQRTAQMMGLTDQRERKVKINNWSKLRREKVLAMRRSFNVDVLKMASVFSTCLILRISITVNKRNLAFQRSEP